VTRTLSDVVFQDNGWTLIEDPAQAATKACQMLPPKEGEATVRGFAKHSAQSFATELTHAGYKDIPVSYLLCEIDLTIPPELQQNMIDLIEEASGRKVDVTSLQADHCPNLSAEKETIDWALSIAKKAQKSQNTA